MYGGRSKQRRYFEENLHQNNIYLYQQSTKSKNWLLSSAHYLNVCIHASMHNELTTIK